MTQAFAGVRIVDFTQVLSGPMATAQLALLGAEVIKIELPGTGDQIRQVLAGPKWGPLGLGAAYQGVNYGKRAITLDLKKDKAKEIVWRLIADADVVVENFKPGVMARLGFDYEAVRAAKPDIVYCSISGFGQTGPKAGAGAYDGAVQAVSGMMSVTGTPETGPMRIGFPVADMGTGLTAAFAISSALYRRKATGEGQYLDVAMTDAVQTLMNFVISHYLVDGVTPRLMGNGSPAFQPTSNVWPTKDGHLAISVFTDPLVPRLCRALGRTGWAEDPLFKTADARRENHDAVYAKVGEILATKTTAEWIAVMEAEAVPAAPVLSFAEALTTDQIAHRGVLMTLPAPGGVEGTVTVPGAGFVASADGPGTDRSPPTLGQHTDEVLAEIGYGPAEIAAFREEGVV